MLCDPTVRVEVEKVATPATSVPLPTCIVPSKNVTLPVGVRLLLPVIVAVNVTLWPAVAGFRLLVRVVAVVAALITSVNVLEVDAELLASPP